MSFTLMFGLIRDVKMTDVRPNECLICVSLG